MNIFTFPDTLQSLLLNTNLGDLVVMTSITKLSRATANSQVFLKELCIRSGIVYTKVDQRVNTLK